jgi:hypothetical protein
LIPAYQIRADNYEISTYYKCGKGTEARLTSYLRLPMSVVPATAEEARRAEICLDVLRALGIVVAVFLIAAINALVAR